MEKMLRASTGGLAEVRGGQEADKAYVPPMLTMREGPLVRFSDKAVRPFLLAGQGAEMIGASLGRGHQSLANACLRYLNISELRSFMAAHRDLDSVRPAEGVAIVRQLFQDFPLLHYALHSVFPHIKEAEDATDNDCPPLHFRPQMDRVFPTWRALFDLDLRCRQRTTYGRGAPMVWLAAEDGLQAWWQDYLTRGRA